MLSKRICDTFDARLSPIFVCPHIATPLTIAESAAHRHVQNRSCDDDLSLLLPTSGVSSLDLGRSSVNGPFVLPNGISLRSASVDDALCGWPRHPIAELDLPL